MDGRRVRHREKINIKDMKRDNSGSTNFLTAGCNGTSSKLTSHLLAVSGIGRPQMCEEKVLDSSSDPVMGN